MAEFEQVAVRPDSLIWFDGEFTGLDASRDLVLEIGVIATDFALNRAGIYTAYVKYDESEVRRLMEANPWWQGREKLAEDLIRGVVEEGVDIEEVDQRLADTTELVKTDQPAILAGNTISTDRLFIDRNFPLFSGRLHYRMLDVSTLKILAQAKFGIEYRKQLNHRSLPDIEESIAEYLALIGLFGNPEDLN